MRPSWARRRARSWTSLPSSAWRRTSLLRTISWREGAPGPKRSRRSGGNAGRNLPAIVLTGDPEHLGAARRKGYILLHKPIGQEHLRLVLGSLLEAKVQ